MTQINAYVGFNGKCREAMTFYKECLGGDLTLQTIESSPIAAQCAPTMQHQILHSTLTKDGVLLLMGSDMVSPAGYIPGNTVALSLNCSSEDEINTVYSKLSQEGKIIDPLKVQFWGAMFGVLIDKYGVNWMLHYDKNQQ
ncbi:MAG TPA: VOC family protein [Segetibacter sp.]|jgi:PhnB protein|nr:VOC family protein [Segetibacter sp.]